MEQLRARLAALQEERDTLAEERDALLASAEAPADDALEDIEAGSREIPDDADDPPSAALLRTIAASLPKRKLRDHAKDLDKAQTFSGEETPVVQIEDFISNIEAIFKLKETPDSIKVTLIIALLRGRALDTFKSFRNEAGDTGNRDTTTWKEFKAWALQALRKDLIVERDKLDLEYEKIEQKGSAEAFIQAYRSLVVRINANPHARAMHTQQSLILRFVKKLKKRVQTLMVDKEYATLEEAYRDATRKDNLSFEAESPAARTPRQQRPPRDASSGTPPPRLLGGSGGPSQAQINAVLSALGLAVNAVERDHSVAPGNPIPKLTPEITAWCKKHNACFRCRQKNADHGAANCPRFPDNERRVNSMAKESQDPAAGPESEEQGNGKSSG